MPFVIDKDHMPQPGAKPGTNGNAAGVVGPRGYRGNTDELRSRFRLLTDDREVLYEGRSHSSSSFQPLECFGEPNAGCTIIQYWESGPGGGWKDL
jgi:hypothetical protein